MLVETTGARCRVSKIIFRPMSKTRILLADDHTIFRESLRDLLDKEDNFECITSVSGGKEAIRLTKDLLPDIVILDIEMPDIDGIEAARQIKLNNPHTSVLMLSAFINKYYVAACLEVGVDGYLLKDVSRVDLMDTIRLIKSGKSVFSFGFSKEILEKSMEVEKGNNSEKIKPLNKRELDVLKLAMKGMTNKEIANNLGITIHTVESHFVNIFRKLGVQSRLQATVRGLREGWLSLEEAKDET